MIRERCISVFVSVKDCSTVHNIFFLNRSLRVARALTYTMIDTCTGARVN